MIKNNAIVRQAKTQGKHLINGFLLKHNNDIKTAIATINITIANT